MAYYYKTDYKYHHLQTNKKKSEGDFHSTENAWTCIYRRVKKFPLKKLKMESPVTKVQSMAVTTTDCRAQNTCYCLFHFFKKTLHNYCIILSRKTLTDTFCFFHSLLPDLQEIIFYSGLGKWTHQHHLHLLTLQFNMHIAKADTSKLCPRQKTSTPVE